MPDTTRYWMTLADRAGAPPAPGGPGPEDHAHEEEGGWALSRRSFLTAAGFGLAGVALVGCSRPAKRTTAPALQASEEVVPGRAVWYAATCGGCSAGCGLLVKVRDGRPIKVEGDPDHPVSRGGVCAAGQAGLLGLYDSRRLRRPRREGNDVAWDEADARIREGLGKARGAGAVVLLTGTTSGPSTLAGIDAFLGAFPGSRHVAYDALSASAILDAHARTHRARVLPRYRFERARTILGVEADFLGTWISPVEHTWGWRQGRTLAGQPPTMSFHAQVESAMTLTGSNADRRFRVAPADVPGFVAHLAARLATRAGAPAAPAPSGAPPVPEKDLDDLVGRLWAQRPRSLVVCGHDDVETQVLVNRCNDLLSAYGETLDVAAPSNQRRGDDAAFGALLEDMEAGKVAALLVAGCNPVADAAGGARFRTALGRVPLRVALAERADETTEGMGWVLPAPHAMEGWQDAEPVAGVLCLSQPVLRPFGEPRSLRECLAAWTGRPGRDPDLLREVWARDPLSRQKGAASAEDFWKAVVERGYAEVKVPEPRARAFDPAALPSRLAERPRPAAGSLALVLQASVGMLDGRHAHNPWLHELPDPITKVVWGNVAQVSPATAARLSLADGDVVRVAGADGAAMELPVALQPGQADDTVVVALGYGRLGTDRFADVGPRWLEGRPTVRKGGTVGANAAPFLVLRGGAVVYAGAEVTLAKTGRREPLARAQTYSTQDLPPRTAPARAPRREAVAETTLATFAKDPAAATPHPEETPDVWAQDHAYTGHRWGMVLDLTACTGCSACVIACQAENNVPVVGRDEVLRRRDMQWIRVDRYYSDRPGEEGGVDVVHQPMMCHHCGNAPCETVCPVLATVHTSEGLNAQAYNRCVGTRYCANNCPYKVRRFNWFSYRRADPLEDLALNPDVVVRSRGVMEKCSMCVQRIEEGRAEAKRLGRPMADGDVRTACQQTCPAGAIVFGDLDDPKSAVAAAAKDPRHYHVLAELNIRPSVGFLVKVRHREGAGEGPHHG